MTPHTRVITNGLNYLHTQQQSGGGFTSESSPSLRPWKPAYSYHTTFVPALMLGSLSHLDTPQAQKIRHNLAQFLLKQKTAQWSFNYWAKAAPERKTMPYPDDLDDTFCALIGLHAHDAKLVHEGTLGHIVKLLIATETQVGGPYRTWLVSDDADSVWQDVDLAVNANILCFLTQVSEPLPNLAALIETAIKQGAYRSPYYPAPYAPWYYLARAYHGSQRHQLEQDIVTHWKHHTKHTPLDTALVLSALIQLNPRQSLITELVQILYKTQQADGSWPAAAFCIDPTRDKQTHYHGSSSLTTALALEALSRHAHALKRPQQETTPEHTSTTPQKAIVKTAQQELRQLPPFLRTQCNQIFRHIITHDDRHEITLLPYMFARSLPAPLQQKLSEQFFVHLGLANLYGWIAYTIYDDFLDDEGQPALLSAANACLRLSVQHFRAALPQNAIFQHYIDEVLNSIDNANTWEVTHCRFAVTSKSITIGELPHYGQRAKLAERSLGHGLAPLATLVCVGIPSDDSRFTMYAQAFSHYLIARQLDDDAHDWKEDLQKGHITYVVARLLKECELHGTQQLNTILPTIEKQFWDHTLINICHTMRMHCQRGRTLLAQIPEIDTVNILAQLFAKTEKSVEKTLQTQKQAHKFLENYRGK